MVPTANTMNNTEDNQPAVQIVLPPTPPEEDAKEDAEVNNEAEETSLSTNDNEANEEPPKETLQPTSVASKDLLALSPMCATDLDDEPIPEMCFIPTEITDDGMEMFTSTMGPSTSQFEGQWPDVYNEVNDLSRLYSSNYNESYAQIPEMSNVLLMSPPTAEIPVQPPCYSEPLCAIGLNNDPEMSFISTDNDSGAELLMSILAPSTSQLKRQSSEESGCSSGYESIEPLDKKCRYNDDFGPSFPGNITEDIVDLPNIEDFDDIDGLGLNDHHDNNDLGFLDDLDDLDILGDFEDNDEQDPEDICTCCCGEVQDAISTMLEKQKLTLRVAEILKTDPNDYEAKIVKNLLKEMDEKDDEE